MPISPLAGTIMLAVVVAFGAAPVLAKGGSAAVEAAVASADLGNEFGQYDAARKCRPVTVESGDTVESSCLKITKTVRVVTSSGPRIYVLLAGDNPESESHASAGVVAFATFAPDEPTWRLVARSAPRRDGERGRANWPENFEVRKLGADRCGWVETTGWAYQGETGGRMILYLPRDGTIVEAGSLPGDHDNLGNCEEGKLKALYGDDCEDVRIAHGVDTSQPEAPHYPFVLTVESKIGARRGLRRYVVPFDPKSYSYVVPTGIP